MKIYFQYTPFLLNSFGLYTEAKPRKIPCFCKPLKCGQGKWRLFAIFTILWLSTVLPAVATGQGNSQPDGKNGRLKIFLDCDDYDDRYIRQEMTYVNYVRYRKQADEHVLAVRQKTTGGGNLTGLPTVTIHISGRAKTSRRPAWPSTW